MLKVSNASIWKECSNVIKIWRKKIKKKKKFRPTDPTLHRACEGKQTIFCFGLMVNVTCLISKLRYLCHYVHNILYIQYKNITLLSYYQQKTSLLTQNEFCFSLNGFWVKRVPFTNTFTNTMHHYNIITSINLESDYWVTIKSM